MGNGGSKEAGGGGKGKDKKGKKGKGKEIVWGSAKRQKVFTALHQIHQDRIINLKLRAKYGRKSAKRKKVEVVLWHGRPANTTKGDPNADVFKDDIKHVTLTAGGNYNGKLCYGHSLLDITFPFETSSKTGLDKVCFHWYKPGATENELMVDLDLGAFTCTWKPSVGSDDVQVDFRYPEACTPVRMSLTFGGIKTEQTQMNRKNRTELKCFEGTMKVISKVNTALRLNAANLMTTGKLVRVPVEVTLALNPPPGMYVEKKTWRGKGKETILVREMLKPLLTWQLPLPRSFAPDTNHAVTIELTTIKYLTVLDNGEWHWDDYEGPEAAAAEREKMADHDTGDAE